MRRRLLIPLGLVLVALVGWFTAAPDPASANGCSLRFLQGTTGTEADPILIANRTDLATVATSSACYASSYVFRQTADIDLSGSAWTPIATGSAFTGTYDGAGHRITGLEVSVSTSGAGLFSFLFEATVRDLVISGGSVVSTASAGSSGALAANANGSDVTRVQVDGTRVVGRYSTGGLIGIVCGGAITHSRSSATVVGSSPVGGLIGTARPLCVVSVGDVSVATPSEAATVSDSSATGAVTGELEVGGLIGELADGTVERSFATGAVTASGEAAGGLVGLTVGSSALVDVYAMGAVSAATGGGGLVGESEAETIITRAYATGRVTGAAPTGGLVGGAFVVPCPTSEISACSVNAPVVAATSFWDSTTTGQATSHGGYGSATSTAGMQSLATYTAAGWPIARGFSTGAGTTWGICPTANGGYPFLQNRYTAATPPCSSTPGKPRKVKMTAGDGTVEVEWEAPAADGGSPVTAYTATARMQKESGKAAPSCTVTAADTSCTITGLKNGRAYRVTLVADNLEGAGTATARTVTPGVGLVVLSTRRSGLEVVTRVRVRSAGRLTQVGRTAGVRGAACRASARPTRAGVVELRCALSAAAAQALAERALTVNLTTTFRPASGPTRTATRALVFARTEDAAAVTG